MQSKLTAWNKWHIMGVGLAVCAMLTGGVYFVGVAPLLGRYDAYVQDRDMLRECTVRARELSRTERDIQKRLAAAREEMARAPLQLASAAAINRRLARLTALAEQMQLQIDTLQPGDSTPGQWYEQVAIDLTVHGGFGDCVALVHHLLRDLRDMGVASLSISRNPAAPEEPTRMQLDLIWFTAPNVSTASASP